MLIIEKYKNWKFKNTTLLIISIFLLFYFSGSEPIVNLIGTIENFGLIGVFIVGMFFVSTFTTIPSLFILTRLTEVVSPAEIILFAGLGAMAGDYLIMRFLKNKVFEELKPLFKIAKIKVISDLFKTPYFAWLTIILGAVIIASPFPDEVGLGLLGLNKIKVWQFFLLSFTLNAFGIGIFVLALKNLPVF